MADAVRPGKLDSWNRDAYRRRLAIPDSVELPENESPDTPKIIPPLPPEPESAKQIVDFGYGSDRQNISIVREAIKKGYIRVAVMPEAVNDITQKALDIADAAMEAGRRGEALQAFKLVKEIQEANVRTVQMIDKADRLDEGKPTSIVHTQEQLDHVKKIVATFRGMPPAELQARNVPVFGGGEASTENADA